MYCNNCGKENNDNNIFCAYCGERIKENEDSELNNKLLCPVCKAETNGEKFCHKCGTQLENLYCSNCGKKLQPNSQFCNECGYSIHSITSNNNSSLALAGFICSIVGIFILPMVLGIIGLILGIIGRNQTNISEKSKKQATTAIILGVVDIVWTFIWTGFIIGLYSSLFY